MLRKPKLLLIVLTVDVVSIMWFRLLLIVDVTIRFG